MKNLYAATFVLHLKYMMKCSKLICQVAEGDVNIWNPQEGLS